MTMLQNLRKNLNTSKKDKTQLCGKFEGINTTHGDHGHALNNKNGTTLYRDIYFDEIDLGSMRAMPNKFDSSGTVSGSTSIMNLSLTTSNGSNGTNNNIRTVGGNSNKEANYIFGEKLTKCITDDESDHQNYDLSKRKYFTDIPALENLEFYNHKEKGKRNHRANDNQNLFDNHHSFIQDITNDKQTELLRYLEPCKGVYPPSYDEVNANKLVRFPIYEHTLPCSASDMPPTYEATIDKLTIASVKFEWTSPFDKIKNPIWKNFIVELNSTQLNFYELDKTLTLDISNYTNNLPEHDENPNNNLTQGSSSISSASSTSSSSSKHGYFKFGNIFNTTPKSTYVFNKRDRDRIVDTVSKHKPRYLNYKNLFKSYSLQFGKLGLPVDYPHMLNGLRLRLEGEQCLLNFPTTDDVILWIMYLEVGISISLDLDLRQPPNYRIVPRRSRYENIHTDNLSGNLGINENASINSLMTTSLGDATNNYNGTNRTFRSNSVSTTSSVVSYGESVRSQNGRRFSNASISTETSNLLAPTISHNINLRNSSIGGLPINYANVPSNISNNTIHRDMLSLEKTVSNNKGRNCLLKDSANTGSCYNSLTGRTSEDHNNNKNHNIGGKLKALFKATDEHLPGEHNGNSKPSYPDNNLHVILTDYSNNETGLAQRTFNQNKIPPIRPHVRRYSNTIDPIHNDIHTVSEFGLMSPLHEMSTNSSHASRLRAEPLSISEDFYDINEINMLSRETTNNSDFTQGLYYTTTNPDNASLWRSRSHSIAGQEQHKASLSQSTIEHQRGFSDNNHLKCPTNAINPNNPNNYTNSSLVSHDTRHTELANFNNESSLSEQNSVYSASEFSDKFIRTRSHSISSTLSYLHNTEDYDDPSDMDKKWKPKGIYISRRKFIRDTLRCIKPLTDETRWVGKAVCRCTDKPRNQYKLQEIQYGEVKSNNLFQTESNVVSKQHNEENEYDNNYRIKNHFLKLLIVGKNNFKTNVSAVYKMNT
ncbi:hypothetical protein TPHA_0F02020 [Tetrapisispora phaffii CBS 4417]|uniref:PH domain-containing protein n=1 Tax=Tetrapisispora phaffii (strain ATCC 24235 / CBS 4417 / NBRC 1672 / NRRL Y-8282 / UCD 70-5) TaxID=1071381 RepID=G8BVA2_TETPH|nr:hypothetical protein TPHA_0F02020 [Tetrapisispora phaffii CBS 4417]CCE63684.1 hypothetical protein TPHA_0F02020 [Tetrapisispora phaffii CBS 4417]